MNKTYIMLKDIPVLEIEDYRCKILNYELLPISLRYPDVNYDDVMHGWTENRTMNIGRTNAKKLDIPYTCTEDSYTGVHCSGDGGQSLDKGNGRALSV